MTGDLKDFYLGTPLPKGCWEYIHTPVTMLPPEIIEQYKLTPLIKNGHIYVKICRGMYGLPQAGKIANDQLTKFLAPHGYTSVPLTHGLWRHSQFDIVFTLVVDDFGVRYTQKADAEHLITTLEQWYKVSTDWEGMRYGRLTLAWDYIAHMCNLSMPRYIERALQCFQHIPSMKPEHAPHAWQQPNYGAKTQYATLDDTTPALNATDVCHVQEVLGTLLYYGRAVNSTIVTSIGKNSTQQAHATQFTMLAITQLLNYCSTHPNAVVRFTASNMILAVESDASYLSVSKACLRVAGYFFLINHRTHPNALYHSNGAIHVHCDIMREVLSSAAEAELGALFHNGKEACPLQIALTKMGHSQPPTPIATNNSTATGIAHETVKQNRLKQLTCDFIGYVIVSNKANLSYIGAKERQIGQIITPNIILPPIIKPPVPHIYMIPLIHAAITSNVLTILLTHAPPPPLFT